MPAGVHATKQIDYEQQSTLVDALQGQEVLIITLGGYASPQTQGKLVEAAITAGVKFILPNEWSPDTANASLVADVAPFASKPPIREKVAVHGKGKTQYIAVMTGFWYEWSLAIAPAYGFDFANKAVTFFDDGKTPIDTTTWPQIGRAVAALLSLPIEPSNGSEASLSSFGNRAIYLSSFNVSQRDIFPSVLRVTGTPAADWKQSFEPSKERYAKGLEQIKHGQKIGFAKMMYSRVFFQDGSGAFSKSKGTVNALLGLPEESIDESTERAMERSKEAQWVGRS